MSADIAIPENRALIRNLPSEQLYLLEQAGQIATEVLDGRVIAWTKDNKSQSWIAAELGCSKQAVSQRQIRLGIQVRPSKVPKGTKVNRLDSSEDSHEHEIVADEDIEIEDEEGGFYPDSTPMAVIGLRGLHKQTLVTAEEELISWGGDWQTLAREWASVRSFFDTAFQSRGQSIPRVIKGEGYVTAHAR